jgi:hypothetical protein
MLLRLAIASLVVGLGVGSAYAEAPGEVVVLVPASTGRDVMADRWAVGLSLGSLSLHPQDTDSTSYSVGELSLRFRATLHLELEATFGGGKTSDSSTQVDVGTIGLRYRFMPRADWNWWLMGAIGELSVATPDASQMTRSDASRGVAELGIGLERRFGHFALQAELTAIAAGEPKTEPAVATPADATTQPTATTTSDTLSGGSLTIGASYYF